MINSTIGKYKLKRLIGEGGMASVYEGEHEMLGTKVAIKLLNPILSNNAQIKERFRNEAKVMASLDHPNIVKVIDFNEHHGQLSIVMEYLNGEDLNDFIKLRGALPEKDIVNYFSQALSALQYAHEKGIVHRDIKPSNIFVLPDGRIKILDFGIAKLFGQGNEMTQTGTQIGTPIYMSPEQVKGEKSIDHRSDIYSLGITMFYAINGNHPYYLDADSQFEIFNKIIFEPLPDFNKGYLSKLNLKACEKDREKRFQTCQEMMDALNQKLTSITESANETIVEALAFDKTIFDRTSVPSEYNTLVESTAADVKKTAFESRKIKDKVIRNNNSIASENPKSSVKNKFLLFLVLGVVAVSIIVRGILFLGQSTYKTVKIGDQYWMDENLNTSIFRNGDTIPEAKTAKEWQKAGKNQLPAWCYYNNDSTNGEKYGKLYNWYAVNDSRGLAPIGWHIPTDEEWKSLRDSLGGAKELNIKMKSSNGRDNNGNGSNEIGFSCLTGGGRDFDGAFKYIGECDFWWSSTRNSNKKAEAYYVYVDEGFRNGALIIRSYKKPIGLSVRCLRD